MKLKEGEKAPEFCLNDKNGRTFCLKGFDDEQTKQQN